MKDENLIYIGSDAALIAAALAVQGRLVGKIRKRPKQTVVADDPPATKIEPEPQSRQVRRAIERRAKKAILRQTKAKS